jgi:hypothetical protein
MENPPLALAPPAPKAPSGCCWPTSTRSSPRSAPRYPLLAYVVQPDEPYDEETALDPVIFAGLLRP